MVYCFLLSFKVAANSVQTGPEGVIFQRTCQRNANIAAAATRGPCAKESLNCRSPLHPLVMVHEVLQQAERGVKEDLSVSEDLLEVAANNGKIEKDIFDVVERSISKSKLPEKRCQTSGQKTNR
ncbi:hypothetical protein AMECASPLE_008308 [Ameca splendens]|uniref:Uncharacterized protein n=1 Tax=Ameca splendens TaxID=208324 RepID=A0ABV0ZVW6_9TELE